jgi:uncharacterized membrane protein
MTAPSTEPAQPEREGEPPRIVLYALYVLMAVVLLAVLVIVGVYGT